MYVVYIKCSYVDVRTMLGEVQSVMETLYYHCYI